MRRPHFYILRDLISLVFVFSYREKHEVQLMGRGHIAGVDIKTQKKESKFYSELLQVRRTQQEKDQEK